MRRRDRHVALVLGGMLFLNVLTALGSVSALYVYRKRFQALSESTVETIKALERNSVDAASNALMLADLAKERAITSDEYDPPVVVGYGQTRTKTALYIYRDVRENGEVHREFVQRIPFSRK